MRNIRISFFGAASTPAVYLKIDGQQNVFTNAETKGEPFLFGPQFTYYKGVATYIGEKTKRPKKVHIQVSPKGVSIIGTVKKAPVEIFNHSSPLELLLQMDHT